MAEAARALFTFAHCLSLLFPFKTSCSSILCPISVVAQSSLHMAEQDLAAPRSECDIHLRHSAMKRQPKGIMSRNLHGHAMCLDDTGQWGAWVREPKLGGTNSWIYLGSHLTQRLAARCQDRALLKLEADPAMPMSIQLTFNREDYEDDEQLRRTLSRDQFLDLLRKESSQSNIEILSTSACLGKFVAQEKAEGMLSIIASEGPFYDIDLHDQGEVHMDTQEFTISGFCSE